jgi:ATP adenylyltransferase
MQPPPHRHLPMPGDLNAEERAELWQLAADGITALTAAMAPHGFNCGMNLGRVAGAGVEGHLHLHVVPRWNGDTNFMPVLADTRVMPEHLSRTLEKLRAAWPSGPTAPGASSS